MRPKLIEFVKCPECLAPLSHVEEDNLLVCLNPECRREYGFLPEGRIPNLLKDESRVLDEPEWQARLDQAGAKPAKPGEEARNPRNKLRRKD